MKKNTCFRILFYLSGLLFLALGLTLNTRATLGVSPIISISYAISEIRGLNFGDTTLVLYALFVVTEIILHGVQKRFGIGVMRGLDESARKNRLKKLWILDVLQFPFSLIFTRFLNLFSAHIPVFAEAYAGSFAGSLGGRILVLALAIVCTGVGAALSLDMRIIPNPGDGIVQAIADTAERGIGFTKNLLDFGCILVSAAIGLFCTGSLVGIGVGTVLAMLFVGRIVALFNHLLLPHLAPLAGVKAQK